MCLIKPIHEVCDVCYDLIRVLPEKDTPGIEYIDINCSYTVWKNKVPLGRGLGIFMKFSINGASLMNQEDITELGTTASAENP